MIIYFYLLLFCLWISLTKCLLSRQTLIINIMLVKVTTKTLIHYQPSNSMAQQVKQNTFNVLSFS